jgi:hypothetical protein
MATLKRLPCPGDLDDRLGDRQAEADPGLRQIALVPAAFERIEDALAILGADAGPCVDHLQRGDLARIADLEDHASGLGELDRVGEEVDQHLPQPALVDAHVVGQALGKIRDEVEPLRLCAGAQHPVDLVEKVAEADGVVLDPHDPVLELADVEQAVDQARQVLGAAADDPRRFARVDLVLALHELGVAVDRVERRSDFMADGGEIAALGEVGGLGHLLLLAELVGGALGGDRGAHPNALLYQHGGGQKTDSDEADQPQHMHLPVVGGRELRGQVSGQRN